jgi:hypothetical protein
MRDLELACMFVQNRATHWVSMHFLTFHLLFYIFKILHFSASTDQACTNSPIANLLPTLVILNFTCSPCLVFGTNMTKPSTLAISASYSWSSSTGFFTSYLGLLVPNLYDILPSLLNSQLESSKNRKTVFAPFYFFGPNCLTILMTVLFINLCTYAHSFFQNQASCSNSIEASSITHKS